MVSVFAFNLAGIEYFGYFPYAGIMQIYCGKNKEKHMPF
jgi:hypothetical protein